MSDNEQNPQKRKREQPEQDEQRIRKRRAKEEKRQRNSVPVPGEEDQNTTAGKQEDATVRKDTSASGANDTQHGTEEEGHKSTRTRTRRHKRGGGKHSKAQVAEAPTNGTLTEPPAAEANPTLHADSNTEGAGDLDMSNVVTEGLSGPKSTKEPDQSNDQRVPEEVAPAVDAQADKKAQKRARKEARRLQKYGDPALEKAKRQAQRENNHDTADTRTAEDIKRDSKDRRRQRKLEQHGREQQALVDASWSVSDTIGGRFLDTAPVFARDERHLLFATEYAMNVYSTENSSLEQSLAAGSSGEITSYALSENNSDLAYIGTRKGYLVFWNWVEGKSLGRWNINSPIFGVAATKCQDSVQDTVFTIDKSGSWKITAHRFGAQDDPSKTELKTVLKHDKPIKSLRVTPQGKAIVVTTPDGILLGRLTANYAGSLKTLEYVWREVSCKQPPTCFDVRPSATRKPGTGSGHDIDVVYGGLGGAIFVYRNIFSMLGMDDKPNKRSSQSRMTDAPQLSWHREAVGGVAFSRDGNYIISGGRETVLVLWQLDTGKKQFLPHLESPIQSLTISPGGSSYAIGLSDNSVIVLSTAELKPTANIAGIQTPVTSMLPSHQFVLPTKEVFDQMVAGEAPTAVRAVVDPTKPNQVLCAVPSHQSAQTSVFPSDPPTPYLQTFSVASDAKASRHISRQALTRTNATNANISPEFRRIQEPSIVHMAMSRNGRWLATVDEWAPPTQDLEDLLVEAEDTTDVLARHREVVLRIWAWHDRTDNDTPGAWYLNTRIDGPHRPDGTSTAARVLALVARPDDSSFATVGEDCEVHVWAPKTRLQNGRIYWSEDPLLVSKGKKIQKEQTQTWWTMLHNIPLPAAMQEDPLQRRTPSRAVLAYSNDSSLLAVHLHFDVVSQALLVRQSIRDIEIDDCEDDQHDLVHFLDADFGDIRESRSSLCPPVTHSRDWTSVLLNDGIHDIGFLERHLIVLTRSTAHIWDVTNFSLVSQVPLPFVQPLSTTKQSLPAFPPPPHLAINLPTSTFAISAPICKKHKDKNQHEPGSDLPPHPHRDYTSLLQIFSVQQQQSHFSSKRSDHDDNRKPLLTETLPRLTLALLSSAGAADGDNDIIDRASAVAITGNHTLPTSASGNDIALAALKRGYVTLDVTATLRTIRPPLSSSVGAQRLQNGIETAASSREASLEPVSAVAGNGRLAARANVNGATTGGHEEQDVEMADEAEQHVEARDLTTNGYETANFRTPRAPRLVSEQKLAEVLEYGGAPGKGRGVGGGLPSVREMFDGVMALLVGYDGGDEQ